MSYSKQLLIAYTCLVIILHVIPVGNLGVASPSNFEFMFFRGDYLIHMLMFLPWMGLVRNYLEGRSMRSVSASSSVSGMGTLSSRNRRAAAGFPMLWLFLGVVLAISAEGVQHWLPYRTFNIMDVIYNVCGVVLGVLVYVWPGSWNDEQTERGQ
jgi:hypothetical protein